MSIDYLEQGSGAETLVLLHGVGGGAAAWQPQLDFFADRYRVLAWNMPGYGRSAPLPEMTFAELSDALRRWFERLALKPGTVHLVGHSIGGMIAQEFVANCPEFLHTLTLSATSPAFGKPNGDWQRRFLQARLGPLDAGHSLAELAPGMVQSLVGDAPDSEGLRLAERCMAQVPETAFRAAMRCIITFDRRASLTTISRPTLVLAGAQDNNAPAAMMAKMAEKIPAARYVCLDGAGHLSNLEQPARFNQVLAQFLKNR